MGMPIQPSMVDPTKCGTSEQASGRREWDGHRRSLLHLQRDQRYIQTVGNQVRAGALSLEFGLLNPQDVNILKLHTHTSYQSCLLSCTASIPWSRLTVTQV
mmetsp:Transcript_45500/g.142892  ORF Transcript_45500/g.142892 Transcript_45500/m.142892 type:complete len:101 (+) Transcript_45500:1577-1879(+)